VELVRWLLKTLVEMQNDCYLDLVHSTKGIQHARNLAIKRFLQTNCTHIYTVDSDCIPQDGVIPKLLAYDLPFISTPAPQIINGEAGLMMLDKVEGGYKQHRPLTGLQKCDAVGGTGLFLKREVLDAITPPWFEFHYDTNGLLSGGEDFAFCEKTIKAGYEIWVQADLAQSHVKEVIL